MVLLKDRSQPKNQRSRVKLFIILSKSDYEKKKKDIEEIALKQKLRIDKAIEYIKEHTLIDYYGMPCFNNTNNINELLEIFRIFCKCNLISWIITDIGIYPGEIKTQAILKSRRLSVN